MISDLSDCTNIDTVYLNDKHHMYNFTFLFQFFLTSVVMAVKVNCPYNITLYLTGGISFIALCSLEYCVYLIHKINHHLLRCK